MKISGGCAMESLDALEEQPDIRADGDINSAMPPKSQMSLHHTVSQFMTNHLLVPIGVYWLLLGHINIQNNF